VEKLEIERLEAERLEEEQEKAKEAGCTPLGTPTRKKSSREREIDELLKLPVMDPTKGMKNRLRLFDIQAARQLLAAAMSGTGKDESRDRLGELLKHLATTGEYRVLCKVPSDWKSRIEQLDKDFPNFREPLSYLRAMLAFSEARDGAVHFEPMLFNGPPGIGKTHFCRSLSTTLGNNFRLLQMEQQQESSGLTGSSKFWSNSRPGSIFESLIYGTEANFLCMIDEVDKASGGEFDPLSGLYGLLERNTAKVFADQSIPWVSLDASRILWVLTSNVIEDIPAPIRSRLRVFSIEAPKPKEMRGIIRRIFEDICSESLNGYPMEPLSEEIVDRLMALPPRRIRPALSEGIGQALFENRRELLPGDIMESVEKKRSIGFTTC
jgi:ATP-dependent Lon protease